MKISLVLVSLLVVVVLTLFVDKGDTLYPYAVKGFVRDVKLKPHLFIGTLALKKFIKLKLIKLKFILFKKLKIKKKIKLALIISLLKKIKKRVIRHRFQGRRKRQAQDYVPYSPEELNEIYEYEDYQDLPGREPRDEDMMPYLTMANELDQDACLPKGVCEVVAKGNGSHLNHFENMVYDLYG
ncbi:unnamed protein product [Allacma fusca]|uniref:Uncharacterized protein n=1 Tax=Allacma fusca TaxID=39272 RepID=A0A8J2KFT0_9HEXA|nr:unnamed protein product [Allacma fusca]